MEIKFSRPQEFILTTTQEVNLFLAGVGSGKTHLGGFESGYLISTFPKVFGFIGANTYHQLTTSTMFRTREVWKEIFGWEEGIDYVVNKKPPKGFITDGHNFDDYHSIISFRNGCVVFKGSLDNAKAHDGKEFGWAILDETKDSREEDVKDTILTRLRMPGIYLSGSKQLVTCKFDPDTGEENKGWNPLFILTSPAKVKWINDWFKLDLYQEDIISLIYDKDKFFTREFSDKCVVISSTYHNRENLPKGFIDKIINNHSEEGAKKLIFANPFVKAGGEFYSGFNRMKHVGRAEYDPEYPLHISFDQNVVPYITMTIYQVKIFNNILHINQIDEICLSNPNNKTSSLCNEFIKRYRNHNSGLFLYGDPAGRKSDTRNAEHDYKIVKRMLKSYLNNKSDRIPYSHPPILKRKDFINNAFENCYEIRITIDYSCKKSIMDFEFVKEDIQGKKSKSRKRDKRTGITFEEFGHTSDSFDYFFVELNKNLFEREFKK